MYPKLKLEMNETELLKAELTKLWQNTLSDSKLPENLREVVKRQFVFCENQVEAAKKNLLVVGINPSYRKNELGKELYDAFNFQQIIKSEKRDPYFHKIHDIIPHNKSFNLLYTDLFYVRQTEQVGLNDFMVAPEGLAFLAEQLRMTQEYIEALKPDLIVIFNKGSWKYWGKNAHRGSNIWMGYEFEKDEKLNCHRIVGITESEAKVNKSIKTTVLQGVPVYFSKFLQFLPHSERCRITDELNVIMNSL